MAKRRTSIETVKRSEEVVSGIIDETINGAKRSAAPETFTHQAKIGRRKGFKARMSGGRKR